MTGGGKEPSGRNDRKANVRWDGVVAVLLGLVVNVWTLEWTVVPDGEIGSPWIRLAVTGFQILLIGTGVYVLVRRPKRRIPWGRFSLAAGSAGLAWFACFAVLDLYAPGLVDLPGVDYFDFRERFRPDSTLVMVPREPERENRSRLTGDLAARGDGLPALDIPYRASYNERGFRRNGGSPPWDAVVIGDSFVAFGESDSLTVSEMLRRASGLSTFNLGRGWYGPHQYVELLRRHGLELAPRFGILCFFEGNDLKDVVEYRKWRGGGSYYDFGLIEGNLFKRFVKVNNAVLGRMEFAAVRILEGANARAPGDEASGGRKTLSISLSDERSKMRFAYWPDSTADPDRLVERDEWRTTRNLVAEFRELASQAGIEPMVVFIPAKLTVYRPFLASDDDPPSKVTSPDSRGSIPSPRAEALRRIASELDVDYLDLTPLFRRHAAREALLYYRQDTHWTPAGRRLAADTIAAFLRERWPEAFELSRLPARSQSP